MHTSNSGSEPKETDGTVKTRKIKEIKEPGERRTVYLQ